MLKYTRKRTKRLLMVELVGKKDYLSTSAGPNTLAM